MRGSYSWTAAPIVLQTLSGAGETASGNSHAFHSLMCAPPTDDGALPGGSNSSANGISPSGTTAVCEVTGLLVHSEVQSPL